MFTLVHHFEGVNPQLGPWFWAFGASDDKRSMFCGAKLLSSWLGAKEEGDSV